MSTASELKELDHLFSIKPTDPSAKIKIVKGLYESSGAAVESKKEISSYTQKAFENLDQLDVLPAHKSELRKFGEELINREF